jgi:recombination protein RecA
MVKLYGSRVTRREDRARYDVIPTGSLGLDMALRVGGWVCGRVHEIVGVPKSSKTTLCICSMREAMAKFPDRGVLYIDMEQTFDDNWAALNGLDTESDRFFHEFPDHSEMASDMLAAACDTKLFSLVVLDSVGAMETKAAMEMDASASSMGKGAQVITRMTKRAVSKARQNNITILLVNQLRANFNPVAMNDIPAGPKILRYMSTTQVDTAFTGETIKLDIDNETEEIGHQFRTRVKRNKVAMDGPQATFYVLRTPTEKYGPAGIYRADEAYGVGVRTRVILPTKEGGHMYQLPGVDKPLNGEAQTKAYLREHPEVAAEVLKLAIATKAGDVRTEADISVVPDFSSEDSEAS